MFAGETLCIPTARDKHFRRVQFMMQFHQLNLKSDVCSTTLAEIEYEGNVVNS